MNLTLAQARAMRWPFRNPRQPMGVLLDQGAITAHDLQRASRAAYSPRFKAACLLLLHETLAPHMPSTPPPRSGGQGATACGSRLVREAEARWASAGVLPTPDTITPAITRRVPLPDQSPSLPFPQVCPICNSKLRISGKRWECVADRSHYWLHRVNHLRVARQHWIESLPPDEQQYRADIWQTASDPDVREQFLIEHALKYPAGS